MICMKKENTSQFVMKKIGLVLVGVLLLGAVSGWGQEVLPQQDIPPSIFSDYNAIWMAISALLGSIVGGVVTWLGVRKMINDWAENEITKKANEKFGVDWAIVMQLVDEKRRDAAIKSKRLAIVNKATGRRHDLVTMLEKFGFKNPPPQFFKLDDFSTKFDDNQFDLIVLDNHDGQLTEAELQEIIVAYQFPYVLYTNSELSPDFFNKFRGKVKFAKIQENVPDYIAQSF